MWLTIVFNLQYNIKHTQYVQCTCIHIYTTRQMTPGFDQSWFWEHYCERTVAHFGWCSWKVVAENVNLFDFVKQICLLPQSGCTVWVSSLAQQHCWRSNAEALVLAELVDLINKAGEWRSHRVHSIHFYSRLPCLPLELWPWLLLLLVLISW